LVGWGGGGGGGGVGVVWGGGGGWLSCGVHESCIAWKGGWPGRTQKNIEKRKVAFTRGRLPKNHRREKDLKFENRGFRKNVRREKKPQLKIQPPLAFKRVTPPLAFKNPQREA